MNRLFISKLLLPMGVAALCTAASFAQTDILNAGESGWVRSDGRHNSNNPVYIAGSVYNTTLNVGQFYHNFLAFSVPVINYAIGAAYVDIFNPAVPNPIPPGQDQDPTHYGYHSPNPTETYAIYGHVLSAADDASLLHGNETGNVALYNAIVSGPQIGTVQVSNASNGQALRIFFNEAGLAAIPRAGGDFIIGGQLTTVTTLPTQPSENAYVFGDTFGGELKQLTISNVPETGSLPLILTGGFAGAVLLARRRKSAR